MFVIKWRKDIQKIMLYNILFVMIFLLTFKEVYIMLNINILKSQSGNLKNRKVSKFNYF